ncbi:FMN-binding protein [Streptacidiphilus sp. PB12-B1b]|uniref:FMN-binding protein n=1 Tax=Streptacidiphilus sp. PB12-B1b TaxID=2705012 RepID=UPI0015F7C855|nr:FMN-binding protein [Streptacidiphilus sp. PB12-B1b]QMU74725.1 FMN-binding protein [Streptacidiphilus sp. PB12-B1b]
MRRITAGLAATAAAVALLIGVKANSASAPRSALAGAGNTQPVPQGPTGAKTPAPGKSAAANGSFQGSVIDTRYGPVQVEAVVKGGRLSNVVVLQQTDGGRSSQIDSYALPLLTAEALKAQSADIDVVSGATYTSTGYAQSLQAALDAAAR